MRGVALPALADTLEELAEPVAAQRRVWNSEICYVANDEWQKIDTLEDDFSDACRALRERMAKMTKSDDRTTIGANSGRIRRRDRRDLRLFPSEREREPAMADFGWCLAESGVLLPASPRRRPCRRNDFVIIEAVVTNSHGGSQNVTDTQF